MKINYLQIFKKALSITWKNKFLWIFGFFSSFLWGISSFSMISRKIDQITGDKTARALDLFYDPSKWEMASSIHFSAFRSLAHANPLALMANLIIMLIVLGIIMLFFWMVFSSQGALFIAVNKLSGNKKTDIKQSFKEGGKRVLQIFSLNLLAKIAIWMSVSIVATIIFYLTMTGTPSFLSFVVYILAFVIFIAISLIISFINIFAVCQTSINNNAIGSSIKLAWKMFSNNWLITIETGVLLFVINLGAGVAMLLGSGIVATPLILLLIAFFYLGLPSAFIFFFYLAILIVVGLLMALSAILSSFHFSSWAILFEQIENKKAVGMIHQIASKK